MVINPLLTIGWIRTKISNVAEVDLGKTPKKTQYMDSGDYKIVKFRDVAYKGITWTQTDKGFVDPAVIGDLKELNAGDVLITSSAHSSEHIGRKLAYVRQLPDIFEKVFYVGELLKVRADRSALAPKYSFYFFLSRNGYKAIQGKVKGVHLTSGEGRKMEIPLPPLNEQHRIVAKIEELFSELDKGIESLKTAQAQLKVYRQSVLKHAFEGRLTAEWRGKNADKLESADQLLAKIKAEREQCYEQQLAEWQEAVDEWEANGRPGKKPSKLKKAKELPPLTEAELAGLPRLPEGWGWVPLGNAVLDAVLGKMLDKQKNKGALRPYLRNINVRWGAFDFSEILEMRFEESEKSRFSLLNGDLVICEGGEPGRCAIWKEQVDDMRFQKALHRIRLPLNFVSNKYIYYFLLYSASNGHLEKFFTGTTIKHLTGQGLQRVQVPIASFREQEQIVNEIEEKLSVEEQLEEDIEENLQKAEALRQSILKKAFEGKLVPQDPNDEPASELLDRIRAEREEERVSATAGKRGNPPRPPTAGRTATPPKRGAKTRGQERLSPWPAATPPRRGVWEQNLPRPPGELMAIPPGRRVLREVIGSSRLWTLERRLRRRSEVGAQKPTPALRATPPGRGFVKMKT